VVLNLNLVLYFSQEVIIMLGAFLLMVMAVYFILYVSINKDKNKEKA